MRVFCSELTKEINILEYKKYDETVNASEILDLEKKTSLRYLYLGKILSDYPELEQECILTAFSMNPTHECFQLVCKLAERHQTTDENVTLKTGTIDALPTMTSADVLFNSKDYDVLRAPNRLLDSMLTMSEGVRSDLVCLLAVPRIKNLNWLVPWHELKMECEQLLGTEKKKQMIENTTAAANDKLQFINLNYDDYKDFTPHEYPGIEAGYEIYVADSDSGESVMIVNGNVSADQDTDTAPESKQFIVKEQQRLRNRKRRLIKRSQQLLEQSEQEMHIKKRFDGTDQKKKKRKISAMSQIDGLSNKRKPLRKRSKKNDSAEECGSIQSIVKLEIPDVEFDIVKTEPEEIKVEPDTQIEVDEKIESDIITECNIKIEPEDPEDERISTDANVAGDNNISLPFAALTNLEPINRTNFERDDSFHSTDIHRDCNEMDGPNSFQTKVEYPELNYQTSPLKISEPNDQSIDSTIIDNTELVNNVILNESKNEPLDQTFPTVCVADFDEDEKINIHFQNMMGNMDELLGLNHNISPQTNDETISMQSTPEITVINELYPLHQQPIQCAVLTVSDKNDMSDIVKFKSAALISNNSQSTCEMSDTVENESVAPISDNITSSCEMSNAMKTESSTPILDDSKGFNELSDTMNIESSAPCLQSPKPKNPLLAFRKPKKILQQNVLTTIDPSNGLSIDSKSSLVTNHMKSYNFDCNDLTCMTPYAVDEQKRNGSTQNLLQKHDLNKISDCVAENQVKILQNI